MTYIAGLSVSILKCALFCVTVATCDTLCLSAGQCMRKSYSRFVCPTFQIFFVYLKIYSYFGRCYVFVNWHGHFIKCDMYVRCVSFTSLIPMRGIEKPPMTLETTQHQQKRTTQRCRQCSAAKLSFVRVNGLTRLGRLEYLSLACCHGRTNEIGSKRNRTDSLLSVRFRLLPIPLAICECNSEKKKRKTIIGNTFLRTSKLSPK